MGKAYFEKLKEAYDKMHRYFYPQTILDEFIPKEEDLLEVKK